MQRIAAMRREPNPLRSAPSAVKDRGAVAVEFALLVPILLVLVFGILNFGVYMSQQLALNNAVRQGARLAVVAGNVNNQECGQVVSSVQQAAGPAIAMNTGDVAVQVILVRSSDATPVGNAAGCTNGFVKTSTDTTRVCEASGDNSIKANAQYATKFLIPVPFLPSQTLTLKATAVYRCEFIS